MPKKGKLTQADADVYGLVPAAPIGRIIDDWAAENWWMDAEAEMGDSLGSTHRLAGAVGIHKDTIVKVRAGTKDWLTFDNADRIVTYIDPWLWRTDPELADIYQNYDFSHLDLARPTCDEADLLSLLDGVIDRHAATILCVGKTTVNRHRRIRKQRLAA